MNNGPLQKAFNNNAGPPFMSEVMELMFCAGKGDVAGVAAFLDKYKNYEGIADQHDGAKHGKTPLMWAARHGHKDVVELLLARGANIDAKDYSGWTALMFVTMCGSCDMMEFLLEKGAAVDAKSYNGTTALTFAQINSRPEAVFVLEEWIERQKRRLAQEERQRKADLEERLKAFSKGTQRSIPAPRPLKVPKPFEK